MRNDDAKMSDAMGGGGGGGGGSGPADVAGPTVVHKVKSKLGYTEMHASAPGFNEEVSKVA